MDLKYKHEAIPAIIYFIISVASLMYVFVYPSSLSGLAIAILTLPWSLLGIAILDHLRLESDVLRVLLGIIGIIVNTFIWLLICRYFTKSK
jgi:hypothetical protein